MTTQLQSSSTAVESVYTAVFVMNWLAAAVASDVSVIERCAALRIIPQTRSGCNEDF